MLAAGEGVRKHRRCFEKMRPRIIAEQMAKAQSLCKNVIQLAMDRARYVMLYRNAGSLDSLRSGVRLWHVLAVSILNYKVDLPAPPRESEHVLSWLSCFANQGTAMNYLQFLENFCEIEGLSTKWYDDTVRAWRRCANKLKIAFG